MIGCSGLCSLLTFHPLHSSSVGRSGRSISPSTTTSPEPSSNLPHETCLSSQERQTKGALVHRAQYGYQLLATRGSREAGHRSEGGSPPIAGWILGRRS